MNNLQDIGAFVAVARHGGFREAARQSGSSPSQLSEAVRRLEAELGVRLLNRTTRSVAATDAGQRLLEQLEPALGAVESALDVVNGFRDRPVGRLRLNVPLSAAKLILPRILPPFMAAYPDIVVEVTVEDSFVDLLRSGCDAGIRYEERMEQDMVAIPIGPKRQRFGLAASPSYLEQHGRPKKPQDLLQHICLRGRFSSGFMPAWEFEHKGRKVVIEPNGPLIVSLGGGAELAVDAALAGSGLVYLFEDWLAPHFARGDLEPVLERWWPSFSGPSLYYPGRRYLPAPLRAFVDFIQAARW
ncbi:MULTISPECIES: LysR family transcriptional regulator [unclassified Duganella]|uniref:LysR family transcriptional regulator n=1 Tax=unclassified Duganella TaxID=2636909 RepID=UPI00087F7BD7|nr:MULTISPECIES: LysR family transcriptional regulator [unclassified Duganella]SDF94427.1 DNA-binding transcriptional regulator, LysR family [Duganella sp. OV458]SDJ10336.1 transcriptional regulator, LysR family [Duganella sp. OV510]